MIWKLFIIKPDKIGLFALEFKCSSRTLNWADNCSQIPFPEGAVAAWIHQHNVSGARKKKEQKKSFFIMAKTASICWWCQPDCWINHNPAIFKVNLLSCCSGNASQLLRLTVRTEFCVVKGVEGWGRWDINPIVCHISLGEVHPAISQWAGSGINEAGLQQLWRDCNSPCPSDTQKFQQIEQTNCVSQVKCSQSKSYYFFFRL